jgi:hypothetical protein
MSPAFVPTMKQFVRTFTREAARDAADRVLRMRTVGEIRGYLTDRVRELCPDITMLDTYK